MAALGHSFNSMTASLAKLIEEQKEKQRLENELSIAYEVQELLFPGPVTALPTLEVHGVCISARTVSGDYYDFIPLGSDRMVLAVGDISGKGISAALVDGHGARLRPRLFPGTGDGLNACLDAGLAGLWVSEGSPHVLPRGWQRGIAGGAGHADDYLELSALPQHAGGQVRHPVSRLL